jgi:hypothetical protein
MNRDLQLRWLRLKRHLRSCSESTRALRDAARAMSSPTDVTSAPVRRSLCHIRNAYRLAA